MCKRIIELLDDVGNIDNNYNDDDRQHTIYDKIGPFSTHAKLCESKKKVFDPKVLNKLERVLIFSIGMNSNRGCPSCLKFVAIDIA